MAHAVMRGTPTKAQLMLEDIIKELVAETGKEEDRYSFSRILFKSLRDHPDRIAIIEAKNERSATNMELLQRAVQVARALSSKGYVSGDVALFVGLNHLEYIAAYFGALFAGMSLFSIEPLMKPYEIQYYLNILKPKIAFVDADKVSNVNEAVKTASMKSMQIVTFHENNVDKSNLDEFIDQESSDIEGYWPQELEKDAVAFLFTTGGTTGLGLPKVAVLTHRGVVAQAPSEWSLELPQPHESCAMLYNGQWVVNIMVIASCILYGATVVVTAEIGGPEVVVRLVRKCKPTWIILGPTEIADAIRCSVYRHGDFYSIKKYVLVGLAPYPGFHEVLKKESSPEALIVNRYGMTEAHGYVCFGDHSRFPDVGPVSNLFLYKILDKNGDNVDLNKPGQLYLKSNEALAKTYLGDEEAAKNMFTEDGWFATGDIVVEQEHGEIRYYERLKCLIYKDGYPISPQELEEVICSVDGVAKAVVCGTDRGAAAMVVPLEGATPTREDIHQVLREKLSEYKHLHGGIAFVDSLPRTYVGKLHRGKCVELIKLLIENKQCY